MNSLFLKALGSLVLLFSWSTTTSASQYYFYYHDDPPEGATPLQRNNVVTPSGKVILNAFDYYTYGLETLPGHIGAVPMDFSSVEFRLSYSYESPAGDGFLDEIKWPMAGLGIYQTTFPKGYYRNWVWTFDWQTAAGAKDFRTVTSPAKLIIPNITKIPVYVYSESLNSGVLRYDDDPTLDMMSLRKLFLDLEETLSMLVTNLRGNYKDNHGCSGWYQFRFMGYVDGFGSGLQTSDDLRRTPPGITIVPTIQRCGNHSGDNIGGCAYVNGNQIAISEYVLRAPGIDKEVVILHEIGHSKGLDHYLDSPDFVMSDRAHSSSVGIVRADCPKFSAPKMYAPQDPWEKNI